MIDSSDIELRYIIKSFISHINFDFSNNDQTMETLRKVEKTYWQYCCHIPHHPKLSFSQYFKHICFLIEKDWNYEDYIVMKSKYNYYKKSIPTAGAMIHYHDNSGIYLLLVKNNRAKVFSLPKGKQEKGEKVRETAIREVMEETGLDISNYINDDMIYNNTISESSVSSDEFEYENRNTIDDDCEEGTNEKTEVDKGQSVEVEKDQSVNFMKQERSFHYESLADKNMIDMYKYYICKSTIYDVQLKEKPTVFSGYDNEEIVDIVWMHTSEIIKNPQLFSRQVKTACQIILEKYQPF